MLCFLPGSTPFASDQLDRGPVMFSTVTQTSFEELKERKVQKRDILNLIFRC